MSDIRLRETPTKLYISGSVDCLDRLAGFFSYRPDRYWMSPKYQAYKRHQDKIAAAKASGQVSLAQSLEQASVGWDGFVRLMVKFPVAEPTMVTRRGHLMAIRERCAEFGYSVDESGLIPNAFSHLTIDDIPDDLLAVELDRDQWEIQKRCMLAWLINGMARNQVTVSGGKTITFCAAAAMVKRRYPKSRIIYLTPTERLVNQVTTEARRLLPGWSITQFGGGVADNTGADMVVCTWAMLHSRYKTLVHQRWFETFNTVLIDECQSATGKTAQRVLLTVPAYFRFAASDTAREDSPNLQMELQGLCGGISERVQTIELIQLDRIAAPTIEVIKCPAWRRKFAGLGSEPEIGSKAHALVGGAWYSGVYAGPAFELNKDGTPKRGKDAKLIVRPGFHKLNVDGELIDIESSWCILNRRYDQAITAFKHRNELVADRAAKYSKQGWPTLVIATRTLHVLLLEAYIKKMLPADMVRILYSAHDREERDDTFLWLKSTPGAVLISPLVKVGVSINELTAGVIADYVADWELARQLIGRFIRKKPGNQPNEAFISMFEELQHPAYHAGSKRLIAKLQGVSGFNWTQSIVDEELALDLGI